MSNIKGLPDKSPLTEQLAAKQGAKQATKNMDPDGISF